MRQQINLDYSQIADVVVASIDLSDYPDFCDAYVESATYQGRDMTEEELEVLNEDGEFVYNHAVEQVF
jgi:hypothetical protein